MCIRGLRKGVNWTQFHHGLKMGKFYTALEKLDHRVLKQSLSSSPYRDELAAIIQCPLVTSENAGKLSDLYRTLSDWLDISVAPLLA